MQVKKIYFDMDQVLADFNGGVKKLCGIDVPEQGTSTHEQDMAMWDAIRTVEHFYDRLEILPGAKEMFEAVYEKYGDKVEILTGIPKPNKHIENAGEDKIAWIRRLFSTDIKVNVVYKAEKLNFCTGPDCILVDDLGRNIADWESRNGTAIQHKNAEDTMKKLRELGIL